MELRSIAESLFTDIFRVHIFRRDKSGVCGEGNDVADPGSAVFCLCVSECDERKNFL